MNSRAIGQKWKENREKRAFRRLMINGGATSKSRL